MVKCLSDDKLVDSNGDNVPSFGDTIITDRYPTDLDATTFGNWLDKGRGVTSAVFNATQVTVNDTSNGEFIWQRVAATEFYAESDADGEAAFQDGGSGVPLDGIVVKAGSPSTPQTFVNPAITVDRQVDNTFFDVKLNY